MNSEQFRFSRIVKFTLVFCLGVLVAAPLGARENGKSTIFVIRGGGGYFPNLGTVVREKFADRGLTTVDFRYHERASAARKIAAAYRGGSLPHGIIMVGYSLGGCGVLEVSRALQAEGIPVRMLVLIETLNKAQTVPANVTECFNLYHVPAFLGTSVRADSANTKLTNFEAYSDGGLGLEYSHFTMPFVEEVHELISGKIVQAIRTTPKKNTSKPRPASSQPATAAPRKSDPWSVTKPASSPGALSRSWKSDR